MELVNMNFTEILSVILITLFIALIIAFPVMWLWNWVIPTIFGLPEITILQALGLYILSVILFKPTVGPTK